MRSEESSNVRSNELTRRRVLGGLIAAAATLPASQVFGGPLASKRNQENREEIALLDEPETTLVDDRLKTIDAHVHVWTPDTERYPLAAKFSRNDMVPPSFTPEELMAHAKPSGVGRVVLIQMSFYGFDNSYMLDTIRKYPGRYAGVAVIDDSAVDADKTMRGLREQGVRGFRIYPRNQPSDSWLGTDSMARMWRAAAELDQAMCLLTNPDALPAVDKMCQAHPKTRVVIDHLARNGVDGTIRQADVDALCRLAKHKETYVKVSAFYALGKKKPPYDDLLPLVRQVYDAYGAKRLMWGSDCPYQVQEQRYAESVAFIEKLDFVSDDDRQWLLYKTAERLFFAE